MRPRTPLPRPLRRGPIGRGMRVHGAAAPERVQKSNGSETAMESTAPKSIRDLLQNGADTDPAIGAPGRADLDYRGLRALVDRTGAALAALGVGPGDRVAIVLPNGPVMATCFLGVATHATAAPLNPAYREDEFDFYISDLRAKVLVVAGGLEIGRANV